MTRPDSWDRAFHGGNRLRGVVFIPGSFGPALLLDHVESPAVGLATVCLVQSLADGAFRRMISIKGRANATQK